MDEAKIVLMGLNNSGKTSLLYRLKLNEVIAPIYTMGFSLQTIEHKETKFTIWDIGGSKQYKSFKPLLSDTDAVVLVVDSTDETAFVQVRHIMDKCLTDEHLKGRPLLVLANKQDLPYAMEVNVISKKLGDGIYEGLEWVGNTLRRLRQLKNTTGVDLV
ncbi:hypothetical protein FRC17_004913 [Serendipita sp. 399]|nr:hypothetical protein FRC17_004913 [Serendipita sp. 399]